MNQELQNHKPVNSQKKFHLIIVGILLATILTLIFFYLWHINKIKILTTKINTLTANQTDNIYCQGQGFFEDKFNTLQEANYSCRDEVERLKSLNSALNSRMGGLKGDINEISNPDTIIYTGMSLIYFTSKIPRTWSVSAFRAPEVINDINKFWYLPAGAIGKSDTTMGIFNWQQIDFFYATNDIIDELIESIKNQDSNNTTATITWSKETIGGIEADVITYPTDNGEVNRDYTGGKKYFVKLPSNIGIKTLVISKQARGDENFEKGFQYFIDSIKFHEPRSLENY